MKYFFMFFCLGFFACTKNVLQTQPNCIIQKINGFKNEPKGNPPQSVIQYFYKGQKVFYIPAQCCDQYSDLLDDNCNLLGHPDGGFAGKGDGTLVNFFEEATNAKTIWKDDR